jgi:hypothetical protein
LQKYKGFSWYPDLPNRPDSSYWIFDPGDSQNPDKNNFLQFTKKMPIF